MRTCIRCDKKIEDPQPFIELQITDWRHGVPSGRNGSFTIHVGCLMNALRS